MIADRERRPQSDPRQHSDHRPRLVLAAIVVVGALLRLPGLTSAPPGLNQDEACNAWNAWCLLQTGRDEWGEPWPVFCMRAMGEYRSTLYAYVLVPFQAVGGLNVWTTRLPAAIGGVLTILVLYGVGVRLFGRRVGLATAALLAINPTHIQMSRWGHEASLTPLLTALPLLVLLWAGLPPANAGQRPRPWRAALAGLVTGVGCYGYPAVRLFVPLLLVGVVLVTGRRWLGLWATRRGILATGAWLATFGATFGPLAYRHVKEPERIGRRGWMTRLWSEHDPTATRVQRVVERYAGHFGPQFLFVTGDVDEIAWSAGTGFMPWYALPLLAAGLVVTVSRWRRSPAARILLVAVALYPAADCLNWHHSLHALRSSAGLWALLLLAGVGLTGVVGALTRRNLLGWSVAVAVAWGVPAAWETGRFLYQYFATRSTQTAVYHGHHVDLIEACRWLRPRLALADAVICTESGFIRPPYITLVTWPHDPGQWFAEPREYVPDGGWDRCIRYGRFHFVHADERAALLQALRGNGRADRVVLLLRPDEAAPGTPVKTIVRPDGDEVLVVWEARL